MDRNNPDCGRTPAPHKLGPVDNIGGRNGACATSRAFASERSDYSRSCRGQSYPGHRATARLSAPIRTVRSPFAKREFETLLHRRSEHRPKLRGAARREQTGDEVVYEDAAGDD